MDLEPLVIKASRELRRKEQEVRRAQEELVRLRAKAEAEVSSAEDRVISEQTHRADSERNFR